MKRSVICVLSVLLLVGCLPIRAAVSTESALPPFSEVKAEFDSMVLQEMTKKGLSHDKAAQKRIETIFAKLKKPGCGVIRLVNTAEVNAMAGPSDVYVNKGLLSFVENDDQLAFVIGHEIGHITAKHIEKSYNRYVKLHKYASAVAGIVSEKTGSEGLYGDCMSVVQAVGPSVINVYAKSDEFEADAIGFNLMHTAGYKSEQCIKLLEKLQSLSGSQRGIAAFLSTHPPVAERVKRLRALAEKSAAQTNQPDGVHRP